MALLTVYTATYNRSHLLPQVYESLCEQTNKEFIWLVVDDGSTDNTRELVQSWIDEHVIEIQYTFKVNGGVHTARDLAYRICTTELIVSCDSDDFLIADGVELILSFWKEHGGEQYAGIFLPFIDTEGNRICSAFPESIHAATYQEFSFKYKVSGDKQTVLRTEIIRGIPDAPVFENERLVPETFKWIQLPDEYPFLLLDRPACVVEYQRDGYSKNVQRCRARNPYGFREMYRSLMVHSRYTKPKLKGALGFIAFSFIVQEYAYLKEGLSPLLLIALTPLGFGLSLVRRYQFWKSSTP